MTAGELQLLDTTLRDGSNAVADGYREDDLRVVLPSLAASGISWLEVGHGVSIGLPATAGAAGIADDRAFELARALCPGARIGAVLVPALTSIAAVESALPRLDFLRLAPGPGMLDACVPYLRRIRRAGVAAFLQLVKTHTYPAETLVATVRPLVEEGLHGLYVVDTAGCMTPDQVSRYVRVLREAFALPIGFHGHDHSSLAMASSLAAIDAGATFVDATLGGVGRGAGTTQLEVLVGLLQARGLCRAVAIDRLFELSLYLWNRFPQASRGADPIEAYYALHGWDALSRQAAVAAAAALDISPFAFIRSVTARATGPWITAQDVADTTTALRATGAPARTRG